MSKDITPSSSTNESSTDELGKPASDTVPTTMGVNSESSVVSSDKPSVPEAAPAPVATSPVSGGAGKKSGWGRRIAFTVVILALLGGAVWAATRLNTPSKPAVSTVTQKDVALIRMGIQEPMLSTFYPGVEGNTIDYDVNSQVFEGLTRFEDKTKVVPALATSWTNPDNSTWVFKLRQGVKFHDGVTMTAQSVKDSLDATTGKDVFGEFNSTIKTVTVVDPSTVKIITDGPDPLLLNKLTYLNIFDTKGKPNDASTGTGPYTLKAGTEATADLTQLVAFNGYYGSKVHVKEVDYVYYAEEKDVLTALQQNKLEIGLLNDQALMAKVGSKFKDYVPETTLVALMVPNTSKPGSPLANKTVRQAVYTALDPVAILKARGLIGTAASQPVPVSIPGYNPTVKRPKTDVAQAKALLAQAGYPNGFTMKFTYFKNAGDLATELQKELGAIGVTLTLDPQTDGPTLQKKAFGGQTDAYYYSLSSDLIDTADVYNGLVYQQKNYSNTALDKLNTEQATTIDPAKRLKLLQQMNSTFMSDYGVFPMYELTGRPTAQRTDLHIEQQNLYSLSGILFSKVYGE